MKILTKLAVLSLCPLYISNCCKAEAMEEWFTRTWKGFVGDGAQNNSQNQLFIDDSYSIQEPHYNGPSVEWQPQSHIFSTSPYSINMTTPYQNSGIPYQQAIYTQPGIVVDTVGISNQTSLQSFVQTTNSTSNGLHLQTVRSTNLTTIPMPRPPERTHFITNDEVAAMKNDKSCTNQLLDLIYWRVVDNCYTLKEINNKNTQERLKIKPDHRLWGIIYDLEAFSQFPGLVDTIQKYADEGLATAQSLLGIMYEKGIGFLKNEQKALHYYGLSSDQGFAQGQNAMGVVYYNGKLVAENKVEAARLFALASDQGYVQAKANLGKCYYRGHGVEKSDEQALKYYFDANLVGAKELITELLTPVPTFGKGILETKLFADLEEELSVLVSLYFPGVKSDSIHLTLLETQQTKLMEYRAWIYDTLTKDVIPLVKRLKTVGPGFLINCLKVKEGTTILRAKTNPAPVFCDPTIMNKSKERYVTLGEENAEISAQFVKVFNFLHEDIFNKLTEVMNVTNDVQNANKVKSSLILEKEKSLFDLGNKLVSLNQHLEQASEKAKVIYENKILKTQCNIELINTEISNLQKEQKVEIFLQKELQNFKEVIFVLTMYIEKGVHNRNDYFLENYPYLRAKRGDH